ncbi:hypothetical protein [Methylacidimicrobium sp. AP8]|uniref:hypothetical protein n=1 Tax=Methylacidimicrobium sp. AP8 TaxID=2730359 RepID=UPI001920E544|nr:hypothetical protein [Methylacidimicrobium sp. AP8]
MKRNLPTQTVPPDPRPFPMRHGRRCLPLLWSVFVLLLTPPLLFGAKPLHPCARPPEISPEAWKDLFWGTPQVIQAQIKAADGATYYDFIEWNPHSKYGVGPIGTYVRAKDGKATRLWTNLVYNGPPEPPWTALGLTFREAVEMRKQNLLPSLQDAIAENRKEEMIRAWHKMAERKPGTPIPHFAESPWDYYPEVIEAAKELGLLPKDFVLPALAPKDQRFLNIMLGIEEPTMTPEEEARQEAIANALARMIRASLEGDRKTAEEANNKLLELLDLSELTGESGDNPSPPQQPPAGNAQGKQPIPPRSR